MSHPGEPPTAAAPAGPGPSPAQVPTPPAAAPPGTPGSPPPSHLQQGPPAPGWPHQPPPPARRDTTRTIAIVALVIASLALVGQLLTLVVPFLFISLLGVFGESFESEESFSEASGPVTVSGGHVTPGPDGTVSGAALAVAVRDLLREGPEGYPYGEVACDSARVGRDATSLCRSPSGWAAIVRFTDSSGDFEVHTSTEVRGPR